GAGGHGFRRAWPGQAQGAPPADSVQAARPGSDAGGEAAARPAMAPGTRHALAVALSARRRQIQVRGIVQGVGFRPFVYHLAQQLCLAGFVQNTSSGLTIEVEGVPAAVGDFVRRLPAEAPPLAHIEEILVAEVAARGETGFAIRGSVAEEGEFVLISPD